MNEILLMLPGPTTADPRVLQAMGKAVVNHRGDEFGEIYTETTQLMSKTFQTQNDSYILTGSGTSAMEAAVSNLVNRGEKIKDKNITFDEYYDLYIKVLKSC